MKTPIISEEKVTKAYDLEYLINGTMTIKQLLALIVYFRGEKFEFNVVDSHILDSILMSKATDYGLVKEWYVEKDSDGNVISEVEGIANIGPNHKFSHFTSNLGVQNEN